jgi:hypothetical protein
MRFYTVLVFLFAVSSISIAQTVQGVEVYEISEVKGQQVYYASHIKSEHMKDSNLIDDEDRAALRGAIGKTGIAMPRLSTPYVDDNCRVQKSRIIITTLLDKKGEQIEIGKNEYNNGEDPLMIIRNDDTITCILMTEGVSQIYTIHKNVTFPDGAKLVTAQTTRNRPLGVSTVSASGKATRIAIPTNKEAETKNTSSNGNSVVLPTASDIDKLKDVAKKGDVKAQLAVALLYFDGTGVNKDVGEALKWLKLAAEKGETDAMKMIGAIYLAGEGVEVDLLLAFDWGHKALKAGDLGGAIVCGGALEAKMQPKAAYKMYAFAASHGSTDAVNYMNQIEAQLTPSELKELKSEIGKK